MHADPRTLPSTAPGAGPAWDLVVPGSGSSGEQARQASLPSTVPPEDHGTQRGVDTPGVPSPQGPSLTCLQPRRMCSPLKEKVMMQTERRLEAVAPSAGALHGHVCVVLPMPSPPVEPLLIRDLGERFSSAWARGRALSLYERRVLCVQPALVVPAAPHPSLPPSPRCPFAFPTPLHCRARPG